MITFTLLDKTQREQWLPLMFDLLYGNMHGIAPGGLCYNREKGEFLTELCDALEKAPRQILMCLLDGKLIGYLQYYTRDDLLMIEEIQLRKEFQRTTLFYSICKHLLRILPGGIAWVEAYADRRNTHSQQLMQKLGMENIAPDDALFLHFRGSADRFLHYFQ